MFNIKWIPSIEEKNKAMSQEQIDSKNKVTNAGYQGKLMTLSSSSLLSSLVVMSNEANRKLFISSGS